MLNRMEKDHTDPQPIRIGTLLINEGFIRKADVTEAIDIQKKESQLAELALGKLLVKKGLIDKHQLQRLLEHPELRESVGEFAVERGLIDPRRLTECLRRKPKQQPLAEALVADGFLTDLDLKAFLEQQLDSVKLCKLAVQLGMISETDLVGILREKQHRRTIGEILCDLNLITPLDLNSVLAKYRKHLRLGEILLKNGWIDQPTLEMALAEHESHAEPLGSILIRKNMLTEDQLFSAFATQYNIPFRKLADLTFNNQQKTALTEIIGKTFSRQFRIVPLSLEGNTLTVAISDPENLEVVQSLRSKRVDLRTQCVLVTKSAMESLFDNLYQDGSSSSVSLESGASPEKVDNTPEQMSPPEPPDQARIETGISPKLPDVADAQKIVSAVELINLILKHALDCGVETIHIDHSPQSTTLKFRAGDILRSPPETWMEQQLQAFSDPVMNAIKEISGLDVACRHRPQDGAFRGDMIDTACPEIGAVDFSVSVCPTLAGESMIIRPIQPHTPAPGLNELSHSDHIVSSLKHVIKDLTGMVLVAAPPGNSRSATLYGILRHIRQPGIKAVTVEDPIAFSMPDAIQIQINPALDLTHSVLLRAALRLDPDVILAGDLPDRASMMLGLEAAGKGVLFLGAMYAVDAAAAISGLRLLDMPPGYPVNRLKAILAQRHVRKICPECAHTYRPGPDEWQPLFDRFPDHLTFHKGAGCPDCGFSGYRGQILLSELLVMTETVVQAMKRGDTENDIRHLIIRSGTKTLIDDGLSKLHQTTLSEIIDAVPLEAAEVFKCIRADSEAASLRKQEKKSEDVEFKTVLSSPEILKADIQRLHSAYEVLIEQTGHRNHRSSLGAFETFIRARHQSICRQYDCDRVIYCVQRRSGNVFLFASPER
jgi:type II secretory ATPase GspE/PulE/Tfp pilus assembly ATPase PilB-like protein